MAKPAAADATCGTLNSGHCYGEDAWNSAPQNEGIYATENVSCMYIPDPGSDFVTEEVWNGTDNSNQGGEKWVELGMEEGLTTTGRGFFWANENLNAPPNDPFVHNIGGSPSLNTNYSLLIEWTGGQNWAVDINGVAADNPNLRRVYGRWI